MQTRNLERLKGIITALPFLTSEDKEYLLQDLQGLKSTYETHETRLSEIQELMDGYAALTNHVIKIVTEEDFAETKNLEAIQRLYLPIFEDDLNREPLKLSLDPSLVDDIERIRHVHPSGAVYDLNGFIELLLNEGITRHTPKKVSLLRVLVACTAACVVLGIVIDQCLAIAR